MALHHINQIELARRWRLSHRTLERWRRQGTGLKLGGRIVYRLIDIEAFEQTGLCETRTKAPARPTPHLRIVSLHSPHRTQK